MIKKIVQIVLFLFLTSFFGSCEKVEEADPLPDPIPKTPDYIINDGFRLEMGSPIKGKLRYPGSGDPDYLWIGNSGNGGLHDTGLSIEHPYYHQLEIGKNYWVQPNSSDVDEVSIYLYWGRYPSQRIAITEGDYTIAHTDTFYVSILKNGKGVLNYGNGSVKEYDNIEFKVTWPSLN